MKVVVIGGGIGGLTAAIALDRLGIDVQVYERAPELREVGAGIALAGNALRTLRNLGLTDGLWSQGLAGGRGSLRNWDGKTLTVIPTDIAPAWIRPAVFHRAELVTFLAQQLDPARLHWGRECVDCSENVDGVTALFRHGEPARGDLLIAADGLKSVVRAKMFGAQGPRYAGYTAWRSVVQFDLSDSLNFSETWGPGRRFGIVPMSRGRVYWFATRNAPEGDRDREGQVKQSLCRIFEGWHAPIQGLIEASTENCILRNDIYDLDPLPRWVQGRCALMGDAAHPMTPDMGQGACQAIEDAVVLAACLKSCADIDSALREYEARRIPRARKFVLRSRLLGALAQLENPVLRWLRDMFVRATPASVARRQVTCLVNFEVLTASERALFEQRL